MVLQHVNMVVWQRADDLFLAVHRLTRQRFPPFEQRELGSQLRRAAFSVAVNIVEGLARRTPRDSLRFFTVSSASLAEVGYGLHAACRLEYVDERTLQEFERRIREVSAPLHGLVRSYRARIGSSGRE